MKIIRTKIFFKDGTKHISYDEVEVVNRNQYARELRKKNPEIERLEFVYEEK